jgi:hypothetical protein
MDTKNPRAELAAHDEEVAVLRQYREGFAGGDAAKLRMLAHGRWSEAAAAELRRRQERIVSVFDDGLLARIAQGSLSVTAMADAMVAGLEGADRSALSREPRWAELAPELRDALTTIAHRELGITTLEVRGRDGLDFHDVGVIGVREALMASYRMGLAHVGG